MVDKRWQQEGSGKTQKFPHRNWSEWRGGRRVGKSSYQTGDFFQIRACLYVQNIVRPWERVGAVGGEDVGLFTPSSFPGECPSEMGLVSALRNLPLSIIKNWTAVTFH